MSGVLVVDVAKGSAAAKAGIQPTRRDATGRVRLGDVITAIDGKKIESPNDLFLALEKYKVGEAVNFTVLRNDRPVQRKLRWKRFSRATSAQWFSFLQGIAGII